MLAPEIALDFVRRNGYDHAELQEMAETRLLGNGAPIGGGSGHGPDEWPEDALIALLQCDDTDVKDAVVDGCKRMYNKVLDWLMFGKERPDEWSGIIERLCRVVDVTSPPELRLCATALLAVTAYNDTMPPEVRSAAVRAAMGYGGDSRDFSLWERLTDDPLLCAYAFNAMLAIDPDSPSIDSALGRLHIRKVADNWNVDTTFLARRTARKRRN